MAENNEVLGISGQMDISDIQATIDNLCNSLQKIGVNTDEMSQRMTKSLNDIAQSDGDLSSKTQQAMSVLKQAMDEAQKSASDFPSILQQAQTDVENCKAAVTKLNDELANTSKKSEGYDALAKQLDNQKQALEASKQTLSDLTEAYGEYREAMGGVSGAYNALSAVATANAAATGADAAASTANAAAKTANAVASGADAVATGADASAHTNNAQKIGEEAQATKTLSDTLAELKQKLVEGQLSEEDYQEAIKKGNEELSQRKEKIKDLKEQTMGGVTVPISNEGGIPFSTTVFAGEEYDKEMSRLEGEIEKEKTAADELKQSIVSLQEAHDGLKTTQETTAQTTQQTTTANDEYTEAIYNATEKYKQAQQALDEYREELKAIAEETGQDVHAFHPTDEQAAKWKELQQNVADTAAHVTELNEASKSGSLPAYGKVLEENLATAKQELQTFLAEIKQVQSSMGESGQIGLSGELSEHWQQLKQNVADAQQKVNDFKASFDSTEEGMIVKLTELQNKLEELQAQKNQALYGTDSPNIIQRAVGNYEFNTGVENGTVSDEDVQKLQTLQEQIDATKEKIAEVKEQLATFGEESTVEEQSTSFANYGASISALKDSIADAKQRLQEYETEYDKLANKENLTDKQQKELQELREKITQTTSDIKDMKEKLREKSGQTFFGSIRNSLNDFREDVKGVGTAIKENISDALDKVSSKVGGSGFGQRFAAEFSQIKGSVNDAASSFGNFLTGNGKIQESLSNLSKAMGGLGIPLSGALTGIRAVTKALWAMCATPIGAILTVIVLGLKAVHTWMTKSAEGQMAYTKIMAYLGSIASSVTDIIIVLGKWIYHLFADNNGPMRDFGKAFVNTFKSAIDTVMNLVGGLGKTIKGIFTLDWDTFKEGISQTGQAIKGAAKTVMSAFETSLKGAVGVVKTVGNAFTDTKMQNEIGNIAKNMLPNAQKAAEIAGKQKQNEIDIANAKSEQADKDKEIAESKEKIYTLTGKAKLEEIAHAKALEKEKYDKIMKLEQQRLDLQKERNNLHEKSLEDIAKERDLQTQVYRIQAQQASSTRMLTRQEEAAKRSLKRQGDSADKAAAKQTEQTKQAQGKYDDTLYSNDQAREKAITDLETKIADTRIKAMKDGFKKTQAERKRQQEKELQQLQEQEETAVAAELKRVKAEFDAQNALRKAQGKSQLQWNPEQEAKNIEETEDVKAIRRAYAVLRQLTVDRQVGDEKKAADDLIASHQSYTDKKIAIDKKYEEDIKAINAAIVEAEKRGDQERVDALRRTRNKRDAEHGKEQIQASFDELKNSPDYAAAFDDLDNASSATIRKLLQRLEEVKSAASSVLNPQDVKTYMDAINNMMDELIDRDPIGMTKELTEQLNEQRASLAQAQAILEKVQKGIQDPSTVKTTRAYTDENRVAQFVPEYYTLAEALALVAKRGDDVKKTSNKVGQAVEKTAEEVGQLSSAIEGLGNAIGGEAGQVISLIGEVGNFAVSTVQTMFSASEAAQKAIEAGSKAMATMEKASAILTIISAAIQMISKISSMMKSTDDYYESYAKKYRDINKLRETVEDYQMAVLKARQEENNWFANTGLQTLQDSWEQHAKSEEAYFNKLYEAQEIYKDKSSTFSKVALPVATAVVAAVAGAFTFGAGAAAVLGVSAAIGAAAAAAGAAVAGYAVGATQQSTISKIAYKSGQTSALNNLRIQTRHKSFWRGQKTADLREWVKQNITDDFGNPAELFDEQGLINLEVAKEVVDNYGDKLQGETKETLEKLIKLREQYDEYKEELQKYVSDTYSPLVENMSDAIWDWLAEGKDALSQFKESASSTFADIGKEMIKQMLLKTVFDGFQDKLTSLYNKYAQKKIDDTELAERMGEIMGQTMNAAEAYMPTLEAFAEKYRDIMAKYGFDVTENQEQSASAKGVTTITYDQANLLVNLATARNIALEKGNEVRKQILEALNAKGFISDYPQETAVQATQSAVPTASETPNDTSTTDAFAELQEILSMIAQGDYDKARATLSEITGADVPSTSGGWQDQMNTSLTEGWAENTNNGQVQQAILSAQQMISVDTSQLRISAQQIQTDISVMRDIQEQGLTQITRIEVNTRPISEILTVVQDIYRITKDNA